MSWRKILTWLVSKMPSTTITVDGKPYLTRYYPLFMKRDFGWGNVYVHHFRSSDQEHELHDHPWSGLSFVLSGGYREWRRVGVSEIVGNPARYLMNPSRYLVVGRDVRPFTFNLIRATDFHRVDLIDEKRGAWTLFFAGRRVKDWCFWNRYTSTVRDWRTNPEAIA